MFSPQNTDQFWGFTKLKKSKNNCPNSYTPHHAHGLHDHAHGHLFLPPSGLCQVYPSSMLTAQMEMQFILEIKNNNAT